MVKILVVDDEESSRLSIQKLVELAGHTVIGCRDGNMALEIMADNEDIAMVVTDVRMPNMDGRELVEKIRSWDHFSKLPIIIISGVVGPKEIAEGLMRGATAFLPKPVKSSDIREYMNRYLHEEQEVSS